MRILYIGQYTAGTTSKMRAQNINEINETGSFEVIDTNVPFYACHLLWKSMAFRFKIGKVIWETNRYILNNLSGQYDLIWVDKAVFIKKSVTQKLRAITRLLVHYTPDAAFKENASNHFFKSLPLYHYAITTKSFEIADYLNYLNDKQLFYIPQGYNRALHYSRNSFHQKKQQVLFIGLYEVSRADIIDALLQSQVSVVLAGKNWGSFISKHHGSPLTYLGEGLFGEDYAKAISEAQFALGLVSKRFPELHTTRTFEIPACGTALITERNKETSLFFKDDEVIFFENENDLISKIKYYFVNQSELKSLTERGTKKVIESGYDYKSQFEKLFKTLVN